MFIQISPETANSVSSKTNAQCQPTVILYRKNQASLITLNNIMIEMQLA